MFSDFRRVLGAVGRHWVRLLRSCTLFYAYGNEPTVVFSTQATGRPASARLHYETVLIPFTWEKGRRQPRDQERTPILHQPQNSVDCGAEGVICCRQLTKRYPGGILAVDQLDLSVEAGEIFGLLGPNGAGKSTTAGMLTTRVIPTSGQALVAGIDVVAHPALAKQMIGLVPQSNTLDRALTVWENLYFHGLFFGMKAKEARQTAHELLVEFRLDDRSTAQVAALVRRHGSTADGGPGYHAQPFGVFLG